MQAIKKIVKGANAARKATFSENGIPQSKAQVELRIAQGGSLDGIMITGDVSLSDIDKMLEKKDADKSAIMRQAYVASFVANGHTNDEASAMADEVINGADITDVVRRYAKATPTIKSGNWEFKTAEEAATHVAGLNQEGKKNFFANLKTCIKINDVEEHVIPLGDLFKKMPSAAATEPDTDTDDDANTAADSVDATDMPSGRSLVVVKGDIKDDDDVKIFAANVTLYGSADAIKALTSGNDATVKVVPKVAGVKTANADYFSRGVIRYLRRKNELSENFSIMDKPRKPKNKKNGSNSNGSNSNGSNSDDDED